jgi:hypothetical protein
VIATPGRLVIFHSYLFYKEFDGIVEQQQFMTLYHNWEFMPSPSLFHYELSLEINF